MRELFNRREHQAIMDETIDLLKHAIELLNQTSTMVDQLHHRMDLLEQRMQPEPTEKPERITTKQAAELVGVGRKTLEDYRAKYWREGIHFFPQAKGYQYNAVLLDDWVKNRFNATAHEQAIELWLSRQASNQLAKSHRRKAG